MLILERPQFPQESVEIGVGDLGRVLLVIEAVVTPNDLSKFIDPTCGIEDAIGRGRHIRTLARVTWRCVQAPTEIRAPVA